MKMKKQQWTKPLPQYAGLTALTTLIFPGGTQCNDDQLVSEERRKILMDEIYIFWIVEIIRSDRRRSVWRMLRLELRSNITAWGEHQIIDDWGIAFQNLTEKESHLSQHLQIVVYLDIESICGIYPDYGWSYT